MEEVTPEALLLRLRRIHHILKNGGDVDGWKGQVAIELAIDTIESLRTQLAEALKGRDAYTEAAKRADDDAIRWATEGVQQIIAERDEARAEAEALRADARRQAEALNMARICAESHHKRADDCGNLARKLLTALNAIDTAMGAKEA